jgi:FlaA1/EpsC-like NDP-sugar epimerase
VRDDENPDGDIEISEVGLRPGEKLYEELLIGNDPQKTEHTQIMKAHEDFLAREELQNVLEGLSESKSPEQVVSWLQRLVPEFEHMRDNEAVA